MIEPGLRTRLDSEVASAAGRVHPKVLPQGTAYPSLTYELVSDPRLHSHDGPDGLVEARYQVTAWSETYGDMKQAAAEVLAALDGFTGTMGTVEVAATFYAGGRDLFDPDEMVHFHPSDFIVQYREG